MLGGFPLWTKARKPAILVMVCVQPHLSDLTLHGASFWTLALLPAMACIQQTFLLPEPDLNDRRLRFTWRPPGPFPPASCSIWVPWLPKENAAIAVLSLHEEFFGMVLSKCGTVSSPWDFLLIYPTLHFHITDVWTQSFCSSTSFAWYFHS